MPENTDLPANRASEPPDDFGASGPFQEHGAAVEELLESVGAETQPEPARRLAGLRGRVALVTGGSSGIGRAIALSFAESGAHVAFNYLNTGPEAQELAHQTAAELRSLEVRIFFRHCDVRRPDEVNSFLAEAVDRLGGLHFLVNNAGIGRDRALWRMGDESWSAVMDTNLNGAFYFTRAAAPTLRGQEWGKIVNVASVHGIRGEFGLSNYISSKAGLIGLTRSAALELGPKNINVNAVAPGYIRTTQLTEQIPAEIMDRAREKSVLGRLGDPQDVAELVLFLCSEGARHITGAVIPVDGGYLL
ncbi:MAG: 3-oxoacyl-ACP reductase FabG [Gemmatimonadetes bacterium]|nr:3-oxoacyl-ACP reductase FabG [Gemmatimonadota bacterium]